MSLTDAELLERIRGGDCSAATSFARRHASWAVDYARKHGAGDHAEDVAQIVLSNMIIRPPSGLRSSSARAYLSKCVSREITRAAAKTLVDGEPPSSLADPRTGLSSVIYRQNLVARVLHAVSTPQQELLYKRFGLGMSPAEIAAATGQRAGTIRMRISRVLARIRGTAKNRA